MRRKVARELLDQGFNIRIGTHGPSMFPLIREGDRITVSPGKDFKIGSLIVFSKDEQMICHRLVRVFEKDGVRHYQTRGDSFFSPDEPVTADQILGMVTRIDREDVSVVRKILIRLHPVLKIGRLNAFVIAALVKLRAIFPDLK